MTTQTNVPQIAQTTTTNTKTQTSQPNAVQEHVRAGARACLEPFGSFQPGRDERGELRVGLVDPAARRHAVGLVLDPILAIQGHKVREDLCPQQLLRTRPQNKRRG